MARRRPRRPHRRVDRLRGGEQRFDPHPRPRPGRDHALAANGRARRRLVPRPQSRSSCCPPAASTGSPTPSGTRTSSSPIPRSASGSSTSAPASGGGTSPASTAAGAGPSSATPTASAGGADDDIDYNDIRVIGGLEWETAHASPRPRRSRLRVRPRDHLRRHATAARIQTRRHVHVPRWASISEPARTGEPVTLTSPMNRYRQLRFVCAHIAAIDDQPVRDASSVAVVDAQSPSAAPSTTRRHPWGGTLVPEGMPLQPRQPLVEPRSAVPGGLAPATSRSPAPVRTAHHAEPVTPPAVDAHRRAALPRPARAARAAGDSRRRADRRHDRPA